MTDDAMLSRKLLIEQVRAELLTDLKKYLIGRCFDGEMIATKDSEALNGYLLLIPDDKYKELFG